MARADVTDRILDAGAALLVEFGWERTSMSAVAERAGVTRPTLYARYANRDELFADVAIRAATQITQRVLAVLPPVTSGAAFVVDLVCAWQSEYRRVPGDPDATIVSLIRPGRELTDRSLAIVRGTLQPLFTIEPQLLDDADEVVETVTRFIMSLMQFESARTRSAAKLRGFVTRRLLPAIGLAPGFAGSVAEDVQRRQRA